MSTGNNNRFVRQSPSGRRLGFMGFVRLSCSVLPAYVDGVDLQIPFDTIDGMSPGFGSLVTGGILTAPGAFRLSESGIYLVTSFVAVDTPGTEISGEVVLGTVVLGASDNIVGQPLSCQGSALLGDVTPAPIADVASVFAVAGAGGHVTSANMLIVQVG